MKISDALKKLDCLYLLDAFEERDVRTVLDLENVLMDKLLVSSSEVKEEDDREEDKDIKEEYVKKVNGLRKKVSSLQKERNKLLESVAKDRRKAKNELLKNLNPIIEAYMQEKKIRLVIDKKNIILADEKLDITKEIIKILNTKLQSIKLN